MNSKLIPFESGEHVLILTVPGKVRAREGCEDGIGSQKKKKNICFVSIICFDMRLP